MSAPPNAFAAFLEKANKKKTPAPAPPAPTPADPAPPGPTPPPPPPGPKGQKRVAEGDNDDNSAPLKKKSSHCRYCTKKGHHFDQCPVRIEREQAIRLEATDVVRKLDTPRFAALESRCSSLEKKLDAAASAAAAAKKEAKKKEKEKEEKIAALEAKIEKLYEFLLSPGGEEKKDEEEEKETEEEEKETEKEGEGDQMETQ
ncbi:hypothetical protein ACKRZS_002600 [Fusarium odoratissimum]